MSKKTPSQGYFVAKRLFDVTAALLGILLTSPLWAAAVVGIEFSDPGPVFFRAERLGKENTLFYMFKFRSMRVPKQESEKSEASFKADTSRIFPWGETMRKLKIDELPQLLNVLGGTMSVVGPRPAAKDQASVMRTGEAAVASTVRPGLTGPAALYDYLYGDSVEEATAYEKLVLPTRLKLEAYYPAHMSVGYDLKMIVYTLVCIIGTACGKTPVHILAELRACAAALPPKEAKKYG